MFNNINEKLSFIEQLDNEKFVTQKEDILTLAADPEPEIRLLLTQELCFFSNDLSECILCMLINDSDVLVRANACDSLSCGATEQSLCALKTKIEHDTYLVRGYAVMSFGDILKKIGADKNYIDFIFNSYKKEKSKWVKLSYLYTFCLLGYKQYIEDIMSAMTHRRYHFRCSAANILLLLIEEKVFEMTDSQKNFIFHCIETEKSYAVETALKKLIAM